MELNQSKNLLTTKILALQNELREILASIHGDERKNTFRLALDMMVVEAYRIAKAHGWHDEERNDGECIALMHSELSEALEALRNGNPKDSHCPEFSSVEVELADVIIRIMDYAGYRDLDIAGAIVAKMEYNRSRPIKHGGKKF